MSIQSHVFLPEYLLESVVSGDPFNIDPNLFLSKATTSQLLEVIHAFHPHFIFDEAARENHEVLKRVFLAMVAPRLRAIPILNLQPAPHYFKFKLKHIIWGLQDSRTTVKTDTVLDPDRIDYFNTHILRYLRNAQYGVAAEKLVEFVHTYQYLNEDEIYELRDAKEDTAETVQECVSSLEQACQSLTGIQFHLLNTVSPKERKDLEMRHQSNIALVKSRISMVERAVRDMGSVSELVEHYQKLLDKNRVTHPAASASQDSHQQQEYPVTPSI